MERKGEKVEEDNVSVTSNEFTAYLDQLGGGRQADFDDEDLDFAGGIGEAEKEEEEEEDNDEEEPAGDDEEEEPVLEGEDEEGFKELGSDDEGGLDEEDLGEESEDDFDEEGFGEEEEEEGGQATGLKPLGSSSGLKKGKKVNTEIYQNCSKYLFILFV